MSESSNMEATDEDTNFLNLVRYTNNFFLGRPQSLVLDDQQTQILASFQSTSPNQRQDD